jgi:hypothetical protein
VPAALKPQPSGGRRQVGDPAGDAGCVPARRCFGRDVRQPAQPRQGLPARPAGHLDDLEQFVLTAGATGKSLGMSVIPGRLRSPARTNQERNLAGRASVPFWWQRGGTAHRTPTVSAMLPGINIWRLPSPHFNGHPACGLVWWMPGASASREWLQGHG